MAEVEAFERPARWDVPFSRELPNPADRQDMTEAEVDRLLRFEPFASMAPSVFPNHLPLRGIIQNDTRIRRYNKGDVVVRQGDYGNSAFLILKGRVRVILEGLSSETLGRRPPQRRSIVRELLQPLLNPRSPESRDPRLYAEARRGQEDVEWSFVQDVTNVLTVHPQAFEETRNEVMEEGEIFGELAALGRIPRAVTVVADSEAELLEIRWQGLRELRKHDDALREYVDDRYRRFGLADTIRTSPLLEELTPDQAQKVADAAVFETYGSYDWYGSYQQWRRREIDPLTKEPIIAQQGHYPNGLILIRAGFARLSRARGHGEQTFSYLGKGDIFGLAELGHGARHEAPVPFTATLRAIGYVDVVRIPTRTFETLILPHLSSEKIPDLPPEALSDADRTSAVKAARPTGGSAARPADEPAVDPGMMEFLVEHRFINGRSVMMIDMERCTGCDDCVRACAEGHENNPVFVRHGPMYNNFMVTNACMHCEDPVCMIGCPTGAIHRNEETGEVVINDLTCIGCQVCASSCPYDNIRMVQVRDRTRDDAVMVDRDGEPILKASKCDLCSDHPGGPACERACPHDALQRVDMRDPDAVARVVNR